MEFSPFFPLNSKNPFQKHSRGTFRPCCNTEIRERDFRALYLPPSSSSHVLLLVYCSATLLCGRSELGIRFPNPVAPRGSFSHMLSRENWKKKKKQKKSASTANLAYAMGGNSWGCLRQSKKKNNLITCAKFGNFFEVATHDVIFHLAEKLF